MNPATSPTGVAWPTLAGGAALVVIGAGVGGVVGGIAALAGLGLARWRSARAVAAAACAMLALAALLTVVEAPATASAVDYLFDFALDRPWASRAGLAAGVLAFVAVILAARAERDRSGPSQPGEAPSGG